VSLFKITYESKSEKNSVYVPKVHGFKISKKSILYPTQVKASAPKVLKRVDESASWTPDEKTQAMK
jgi:hypothetical protein